MLLSFVLHDATGPVLSSFDNSYLWEGGFFLKKRLRQLRGEMWCSFGFHFKSINKPKPTH